MATSLIRSRAAITGTKDRFTWNEVKDGAVLQEDGVIVEVGTYDDLSARHPTVPVIGTGKEILLPGFVNGHHHVGLTPVQLGSPDMPLELWFITRMVIRNLDLYLDTLYSAFEMIGSGITTVQHIQGWMPGTLPDVEKRATETIKAYEARGLDKGNLILIPLVLAGYARYLKGIDDNGQAFEPSTDPLLAELQAIVAPLEVKEGEQDFSCLKKLYSRVDVFGVDLYAVGLGEKIEAMAKELFAGPGAVRKTLHKYTLAR